MSELKRALNAAADDLANALTDELTRRDKVRALPDLSELAESINLEHLAGNLSLYDLAQKIDLSDLAGEVEVDPEDIASHVDVDDVAACIQVGDLVRELDTDDIATRLAGEIDLDNLAERVTDSVMDSSLPDLSKRVLDLQTQLSTIGDHLFILACNLRGDNTARWDATAATLGEAADLVPDNRTDGNGIRIADLEAVEDELPGVDHRP